MPRLADHRLGGPGLDEAARVHDGEAVGDLDGHAHVVGDEDHRHAQLPLQPAQQQDDLDLHGDVYLFIYRTRHSYDAYAWVDNVRYCTVFALGRSFDEAERIAINCVHQHGWRILKTDTATAFAIDRFTDGGTDAAHVANLLDFGVSFKLNR